MISEPADKHEIVQLKRYWIAPARWDDYLAIWRKIAAVRERCGFTICCAFVDRDANVFTWAISHPDFEAGAAAYYADAERKLYSRTDYDPLTGAYSDDPDRAGQANIEDLIIRAEIGFVTQEQLA